MSGPTPGPLLFKGDEVYQESTGRTLARLCGYGTPADGALYAAAPDLLLNLQELARLVEQHQSGALVTWPASALPHARAAIAAAGGAP